MRWEFYERDDEAPLPHRGLRGGRHHRQVLHVDLQERDPQPLVGGVVSTRNCMPLGELLVYVSL